MKKAVVAMFTLSMVFLYAFSTIQASAAVGSQEVEKTFVYECGPIMPGIPPNLELSNNIFHATVPDRVKAGEEFYLTNVSLTIYWDYTDEHVIFEQPNFKINYDNGANTVHTFIEDDFEMIAPSDVPRPVEVPFITDEPIEVGPFIAAEEGEVTLTADEIRMNAALYLGDMPLSIGYTCLVPEGEEFLLATIPIDSEAPEITLNGDNPMIVKLGDPYEELGATAKDNFDGDVSDAIEISGDVDSDTIGTYTVTYTVSDSVGNETTVERIVEVVEPFGSWLTGEGAPSDEIGSNGDSYLDTTTGDIHKRDPNTWTKIGNLKGDDGKQGSAILTGSGSPSNGDGDVGDLYFDTNSGDVYEKDADGWKTIANLQGPEGPQGPKGSGGDSGPGGDGTGKKSDTSKKVTVDGDSEDKDSTTNGGKLPKTATSLPTLMLIGTLLATAGGVLFLRRRKAIE